NDSYLGSSHFKWREIKKEHADYAARLVKAYISELEGKEDDASLEALHYYNSIIPKIIPVISDSQAERLFDLFKINDIIQFYNLDSSSGYNPLSGLYSDNLNAETWKKKAAQKMHEVIKKEKSGEASPRAYYEDAIKCYSDILNSLTRGRYVSKEFFQEEINF